MVNYSYYSLFLFAVVSLLQCTHTYTIVDLNGTWQFRSSNGTIKGNGTVPGDIYTDLMSNNIIDNVLYGDNHLHLKWVARDSWTYSRSFDAPPGVSSASKTLLSFDGLDTIATVILNGDVILKADNQFRKYTVNVSLRKTNEISIEFQSPVQYAKQKSDEYYLQHGHHVPPVCPPEILRGECHPNFIRKAQYSFAWDWGPAFPTMGISGPIQLISVDETYVDQISWSTRRDGTSWNVLFTYGELHRTGIKELDWHIQIPELNIDKRIRINPKNSQLSLEIPADHNVSLWWPSGLGEAKQYEFNLIIGKQVTHGKLAFRTVELVQDYINPKKKKKGRHFYFKINDVPVFLKGSNWIPASMFPSKQLQKRKEFLLDSAVAAGMNVLRVWGGGVYETEDFYNYADEHGILIWQDLMFACALYPTHSDFLENVKEEVVEQVNRMKKHPSIFVWAGNNENEIAIRSHWWAEQNYTEAKQVVDYVALYKSVIAPAVKGVDNTRPFLLSSPSNGIETENEGGVAMYPGDNRYGDIHYYNELVDLWMDNLYPTPRCASEYGVQSIPFRSTMLNSLDEASWEYFSPKYNHRQHHSAGIVTHLFLIFSHFPIPTECTLYGLASIQLCEHTRSGAFMDRLSFYSQVHQAITYKVQTEHYRRYRNLLTREGLGNTMCAMYWQLNDVWAAPTWSTVDFELRWKVAHYEAKRFFAPLIVSIYSSGQNLGISVVNDYRDAILNLTLSIEMYTWGNGLEPIFEESKQINVAPLTAMEVNFETEDNEVSLKDYDSDYLYKASLKWNNGSLAAPETVLIPDRLFEVSFNAFGNVEVQAVTKKTDLQYTIVISSTSLSPYTWVSCKKKFTGWFSDNAFTMTTSRKEIQLILRDPVELKLDDFTVCNLKNCGVTEGSFDS